MNVTIIGAGNMGRGIGHRMVAGGHDVTIVDRDPEEAERLAEELRGATEAGTTVEAEGPARSCAQGPLGLNFQSAWKLIS